MKAQELETLLKEVGFNKCIFCNPCDSDDEHLKNIDQHQYEIGKEFNAIESVIIDAYK